MAEVRQRLEASVGLVKLPPWPQSTAAAAPNAAAFVAHQFGKAVRLIANIAAFDSLLPRAGLISMALERLLQQQACFAFESISLRLWHPTVALLAVNGALEVIMQHTSSPTHSKANMRPDSCPYLLSPWSLPTRRAANTASIWNAAAADLLGWSIRQHGVCSEAL